MRPRSGLLRGREFIMKDLYTFDTTEKLALQTYQEVILAYKKIFEKIGLPFSVVSIKYYIILARQLLYKTLKLYSYKNQVTRILQTHSKKSKIKIMFLNEKYSQLFIEYDQYNVHIDIHLMNFSKKNVQTIFRNYIEKYKGREINQLYIKFWDKAIAGDYLSLCRKNINETYYTKPLNGLKFICAEYNYKNTLKLIGKVSTVSS